jgi:thioredoxin reductase (NADPH)
MRDCDLIIIGAGVAGLTAAMTAGRYGLQVVVVDRMGVGGQIVNAERIENFAGFPLGIGGHELGPLLHEQAEAAGAELMLDTVEALAIEGEHRIVRCAGETLRAPAVIIAAGSALRSLGIPGEERLLGRGVSYCASCDGPMFRGQDVCVVGGGDAALDEALVLAGHASRVMIFHRGRELRAQKALRDRVAAAGNIAIVLETVVEEIIGGDVVAAVRLRALTSGETHSQAVKAVFVAVGLDANTAFLHGLLALDPAGHIETDVMMQTSLPGIFAAGDIRKHSVALLAACAGDGATAAMAAFRYVTARARSPD